MHTLKENLRMNLPLEMGSDYDYRYLVEFSFCEHWPHKMHIISSLLNAYTMSPRKSNRRTYSCMDIIKPHVDRIYIQET